MRRSSRKRLAYDERFEHPARTWASSSHREFTHAAVGIAMAAATFRFMQETAKTAMRRVLGICGGQGETLVPPTQRWQEATRDLYLNQRHPTLHPTSNNNNSGYAL